MVASLSVQERFQAFVVVTDGCWVWHGGRDPDGYGIFSAEGRVCTRAHRWAYRHWVGPIPSGLQIDHLCRNLSCVNPSHLEPVTHRENQVRGETFISENTRKTQCSNGHPFDESNTGTRARPSGGRYCRACQRAAVRRYRTQKMEMV